MLKFRISVLTLFFCSLCNAQTVPNTDSTALHFTYKLSYVSSVIYPGISAGAEIPLLSINNKLLKKAKPLYFKERFIAGNLNWYHHPGFHDNLYVTAEWVLRRTHYRGFISEFSMGPGFSRTFLGGTTYSVDENGVVSVIKLAGYNYALISIGGGMGYDFSMHKNMPFSIFAKINLISMFPYNSTIYFRPVLEIGVRYTPYKSRFLQQKRSVTIGQK
jgi:hypothetical protein